MKMKTFIAAFALLSISSLALASSVNLYEEAKANSKTVGTINLAEGVIPIFHPQNGEWVKVADPKNGNVGWVKYSQLHQANANSQVTFTQRIVNAGNGAHTYQIIEYGAPQIPGKVNIDKKIQQMHMQQRAFHQSMQHAVHELMEEMSAMDPWDHEVGPMVVPVMIMPEGEFRPAPALKKVENAQPKAVNANTATTAQLKPEPTETLKSAKMLASK